MKKVLLVRYGEIALRGKNRHLFEYRLMDTIRKNLSFGKYIVSREQGRILVEAEQGDIDYDETVPAVINIFGLLGVCPCVQTNNRDIVNLEQIAHSYMFEHYGAKATSFKVETRRADKNYPIESREVSARVGGYILNSMDNLTVDVHKPEITLNIEIRNKAYIYSNVIKGLGGLPVGSCGRGMLLLSGGIDSPVAGFLTAKRGVELEAVYFHSPPYTSERARLKVCDLATRLEYFTGNIHLNIVPFTDVQLYLYENVPPEKLTIFLKRAMLKIAEKLALRKNCQCLIMGDSIGQVASQTLYSIQAINSAAALPIIRPLAGMDKQEIIDIAQKIETFNISIQPYEDCCTIFVAKHPDLRPKVNIIENMEKNLKELDRLIDIAISGIKF